MLYRIEAERPLSDFFCALMAFYPLFRGCRKAGLRRGESAPFPGNPSEAASAQRDSYLISKNAPHVLSRNRPSMFDATHFDRSSSSALRRGVVRAIAREILRVSRALECNFASLEVRSVRLRRSRARLTLLFSAKYILLLCSICAMLLKIFSRSEENSLESRGKRVFHSFGSPSESRIHRRIAPTVESPAATRRALCLLL